MIYVLTRTTGRPRFFARQRESLARQTHRDFAHVIHAEPDADYARGEIIVDGPRAPRTPSDTAPWEMHFTRLFDRLASEPEGWVIFLDDDDEFVDDEALARAASYCSDPDSLPVWKTERENGRISPVVFGGDLSSRDGRLCWESGAVHTRHLALARSLVRPLDGGDGIFWAGLARSLRVEWHDDVIARPQLRGRAGKGKGRRRDLASLTVAVPVLGRPQNVAKVASMYDHPDVDLLFLPGPDDRPTIKAIERIGGSLALAPIVPEFGVPTFSSKINHAYRVTSSPFLLYVGDDAIPQGDWWPRAHRTLDDERIGLLAVRDQHYLVQRGLLATHGIIRRSYVEQHGSASLPDAGPVLSEAYRHWCCDCEVSFVARERGAFALARDVIFRHTRRKRGDATYALGESFAERDRATLRERVPSWPNVPSETVSAPAIAAPAITVTSIEPNASITTTVVSLKARRSSRERTLSQLRAAGLDPLVIESDPESEGFGPYGCPAANAAVSQRALDAALAANGDLLFCEDDIDLAPSFPAALDLARATREITYLYVHDDPQRMTRHYGAAVASEILGGIPYSLQAMPLRSANELLNAQTIYIPRHRLRDLPRLHPKRSFDVSLWMHLFSQHVRPYVILPHPVQHRVDTRGRDPGRSVRPSERRRSMTYRTEA